MRNLVGALSWQRRTHSPPSRFFYFTQLVLLNPTNRRLLIPLGVLLLLSGLAIPLLQNAAFRDSIAIPYMLGRSAFISSSDPIFADAIITGASPHLASQIEARLAVWNVGQGAPGTLNEIRQDLLTLAPVADVAIRVRNDRRLAIDLVENTPALIWHIDGTYVLVDRDGRRLTTIADRSNHPDLVLISGAGANTRIEQALAIYDHSWTLTQMIRGLVWVGERRWDIVLDRGRVIMLPEREPLAALALLDALDESSGLYDLDLAVIDLRNRGQIVVRKRPVR